jgi:hypothetical protein
MSDELTIQSASVSDDGQHLNLRVTVHNPAKRTRFVYASIRALRYDPSAKRLELQLSDHGLIEPRDLRGPPPSGATFTLPEMLEVQPGSAAEVTVQLERTIVRIDPARSTDVLRFQVLPAHEATVIKVDVAWGETPFYLDPRKPGEMRKQLVAWSKGVATHRSTRSPGASKGEGE